MEEITIRQATRKDADTIHELHIHSVKELCKIWYSDELMHGWIDCRTSANFFWAIDQNILFVAIKDTDIVGFGGAIPGEIWAVYVLPSQIKLCIGSAILGHAMEIALIKKSSIIVESTLNAAGFYAKNGFVELERKTARHGSVDLPVIVMEYKPPPKEKN
jgi:GNAT superfamily N-acetyltransferase